VRKNLNKILPLLKQKEPRRQLLLYYCRRHLILLYLLFGDVLLLFVLFLMNQIFYFYLYYRIGIHWVRLLFFDLFLLGIDSAFAFVECKSKRQNASTSIKNGLYW